jgi:hypothetical protein
MPSGGDRKECIKNIEDKTIHLEDREGDGRIILKWVLRT